jgi:hypothetical protein
MVDRNSHPKYFPTFVPANAPVDSYLQGWNYNAPPGYYPILNTGLSQPIYNLNGNIHRSLPLENWPNAMSYDNQGFLMDRYGKVYNKAPFLKQYNM